MDAKKYQEIATAYRADTNRVGGVVLIWSSEVYGWKDKLRDAQHERPGAVAVDADGHVFTATGGDDNNGAKHWVLAGDNGTAEWLKKKQAIREEENSHSPVNWSRFEVRNKELAEYIIAKYPQGIGRVDCIGRGTPRHFLNKLKKGEQMAKSGAEITLEQVRKRFNEMVGDSTTFMLGDYESLEDAVESLVKSTHAKLQDFAVLDQQMIDDQSEDYDGYLDGASVGDLVFGDDECWVSQLTVDQWRFNAEQCISKSYNSINDIAEYIENDMALERLSAHNDSTNQ